MYLVTIMELNKKDYYYLKFIFFIRYFADAMFYSFTALYLANVGFMEGMIGTIASITTITALIVNPIWSYFAKNNKVSRILLFILSIIEGTFIIIYGNLNILGAIMLLTALLSICASPYYNLLDGYAMSFSEQTGIEYSKFRVMGSIAYVIGLPLGGILIDYLGYTFVFAISGSLFIIAGLLTIFLKKIIVQKNGVEAKRDYKKIITNKYFIIYIIFYLLIVTVSTLGDNYISLLFTKEKGLTAAQYSFVYSLIVICEVVIIFILAKFFRRTNPIRLILFAGVMLFMRSFIISFLDLPVYILIPVACLRGLGWGTILFVHFKYMTKLVGVENVTTAAILLSSVQALFQFIMSNVIGYVIEGMGYSFTYRALGLIVIISTLSYFIIVRLMPKKAE